MPAPCTIRTTPLHPQNLCLLHPASHRISKPLTVTSAATQPPCIPSGMQDSSGLNLISAYSDSDASSDDNGSDQPPSACHKGAGARAVESEPQDTKSQAASALNVLQIKVRRAIQHSASTGRTFNEQLRSHTDFRNPAIVTQLAARFCVSSHDSNLPMSSWNPRALDSEGTLTSIRQGAEKRIAARRTTSLKLGDFVAPASKASKWD